MSAAADADRYAMKPYLLILVLKYLTSKRFSLIQARDEPKINSKAEAVLAKLTTDNCTVSQSQRI
jgi:hypothetical protein